jgi:phosphatidylglycerol:prolipoprotein diacylglycerol transferase
LWALGRRLRPVAVFGSYLMLSGAARLLAEMVRINPHVVLDLTEAQLIGIASIILGAALILRDTFHPAAPVSNVSAADPSSAVPSPHPVGR